MSDCPQSPYHATSSSACPSCGALPAWVFRYFDDAGVPREAPHAAAAFDMFAIADLTALLRAFRRAGPSAEAGLGVAFRLGGLNAARDFVRSLDLPGVKVDQWGLVVWAMPTATDVRHAGQEFREQLDAACRLGGHSAVEALVDGLLCRSGYGDLDEAQGRSP